MKENIKAAIDRYVKRRCPTGSFLRAVLENNLMEAIGRADDENRVSLFEICSYIHNKCPSICYGSPKKVKEWLNPKDADLCGRIAKGDPSTV